MCSGRAFTTYKEQSTTSSWTASQRRVSSGRRRRLDDRCRGDGVSQVTDVATASSWTDSVLRCRRNAARRRSPCRTASSDFTAADYWSTGPPASKCRTPIPVITRHRLLLPTAQQRHHGSSTSFYLCPIYQRHTKTDRRTPDVVIGRRQFQHPAEPQIHRSSRISDWNLPPRPSPVRRRCANAYRSPDAVDFIPRTRNWPTVGFRFRQPVRGEHRCWRGTSP